MVDFIDKTLSAPGTPLNRATMMAIQGMENKTLTFSENSITEVSVIGEKTTTTTTTLKNDGSITVTVVGEKTVVKNISIGEDGNISEVLF